jgi:hypothetical protein
MATYNNGVNTEVGQTGTTTLTPGAGVTSATLDLVGMLATRDISAGTGVTTTVDNTVAVGNDLNLITAGVINSESVTFGAAGGKYIVGTTASFLSLNLLSVMRFG